MAATAEGRALTDAHRIAQARIGARTFARMLESWRLLHLADLDTSMTAWLPVVVGQVQQEYTASQRLAQTYLTEYRRVEGVTDGQTVLTSFDTAGAAVTARVAGPVAVKRLIGGGLDPEQAFDRGKRAIAGRAYGQAMYGGRMLVVNSARATPRRIWRRVSDGNPCAFCALLVSRSIQMPYVQRPDFRSHAHCGCTVEEASEDDPYTDLEAEWVDAYEQAARQAREAGEPVVAPSGRRRRDTVLWRMRRNRPDLFNDGVHGH